MLERPLLTRCSSWARISRSQPEASSLASTTLLGRLGLGRLLLHSSSDRFSQVPRWNNFAEVFALCLTSTPSTDPAIRRAARYRPGERRAGGAARHSRSSRLRRRRCHALRQSDTPDFCDLSKLLRTSLHKQRQSTVKSGSDSPKRTVQPESLLCGPGVSRPLIQDPS